MITRRVWLAAFGASTMASLALGKYFYSRRNSEVTTLTTWSGSIVPKNNEELLLTRVGSRIPQKIVKSPYPE